MICEDIDLVINYDVPNDSEDAYTAKDEQRGQKQIGTAITLVSETEQLKLFTMKELLESCA